MEQNKLCDYGCGRSAIYQFKNGKWCCSEIHTKCSKFINKNTGIKKHKRSKPKLCEFGCGKPAKYPLKSGWCCSKNKSFCEMMKDKFYKNGLIKKPKRKNPGLCEYGCGQEAKHQLKNKKWCCSYHQSKCINIKLKIGFSVRKPRREKPDLCDFGCGNPALFYFGGSKKWCCSKSFNSCPTSRKIQSNHMFNVWSNSNSYFGSKEWKIKNSNGLKKVWADKNSVYHTTRYWENRAKGENQKPNKPETLLIELFKKLKLSYEYVGDYKVWIDGKNPDFINKDKKKIIEFFGWRHTEEATGILNEDHEQIRINHFNKNGYKCLVIWENELKNISDIIQRILEFER